MLMTDVQPTTLVGVKRLAAELRNKLGLKHSDALDRAARSANCENFRHAQRTLPASGVARSGHYVLLTIYWHDKKQRNQCGRETLRVELSAPLLEICAKHALKHVRGFGDLRMAAADHFLCDLIAPSQEYARERLCTAERSLRFMEHTGLRPCRSVREIEDVGSGGDKLPGLDHSTNWLDPANGQYILIDEPYDSPTNEKERAAWAKRRGWTIVKASWPGMYSPYSCDLYVMANARSGYALDPLVAKVNAIPAPLIIGNWAGDSARSWETFFSPMAKSNQDRRCARCGGMIYPQDSKTTVPYSYEPGSVGRRPIGSLGIDGHFEAGRVIKAALSETGASDACYMRLGRLRSTLEYWLSLEIGRGQLEGPEFFEVYYRSTERDQSYQKSIRSCADLIAALEGLKQKLLHAYADCAPLRQQTRRIDMTISWLGRHAAKTPLAG